MKDVKHASSLPPSVSDNIQLSHLINFSLRQLKQTLFFWVKEPVISDALVPKCLAADIA